MGLLQAIALEALSGYFPGLDPDSLRVNVLKGRVDLKDVVLTPGQVFASAGFPFRLMRGTVGELGLRVPWASIYSAPVKVNAHHVEIHFGEVPFPESQHEVFEAFRNASRRTKNRTLAEGERAESAVTRALQKLFPMLLDRVEANISDVKLFLHFATGEVARLSFQEFKISSSESSIHGTLPKNRGDLAKVIRMKGISVTLDDRGSECFALDETGIQVMLCLGDGVYRIDVSLREQIKIAIDSSFEEFFYNVKNRITSWNSATKYNRPLQAPSEDARAWFKYALRATCGRKGITRSELSVEGCRQAIASFLEYKRLHVLRLRKGYAMNAGEEEQIHKLEDLLDADMILLLRSNARADVMAEEVSAFATKEWLSWVFFDRRMSEEQEHLAGEIRKSLSVVERREREENETGRTSSSRAEALSALSKSWSSAKISFTMKGLTILVTTAGSDLGSVLFGSTCCRAELDSAMRSYGILLTMSNLVIKDENRFIFRRGEICSEGQDDVDVSGNRYFFEAKLQKPALGDDISITLRLAPCTAILNVTQLAKYSSVMRVINVFQNSSRPDIVVSEESKIVRRSSGTSSTPKLTLEASLFGVDLLLGNGRSAPDVATTEVWFLITLSTGTILVNDVLSCPRIHGNYSGSIKNSESVAYQRGLHYGRSGFPSIHPVRNGHLLSVSTTLSLELSENRVCLEITNLEAYVTSCGVRDLLCVLRIANDSFGRITFEAGAEESRASQHIRKKGTGSLIYSLHIEVASLKCVVEEGTAGRESRNLITISATELEGVVRDGLLRSITVKEANIAEDLYGGNVRLAATSRLPFGVRMECVDRSHAMVTDVDMTIASVSILLRPESVHDFISMALRFRETVQEGIPIVAIAKPSAENTCRSQSNRPAEVPPRLSFLLHDVRLECTCEGSHVLLSCQNTYVVTHRSVLSGSLDGLVCTDLSGLSGTHSVAIRHVSSSIPRQPDRRALSFNIAPNSANIHLHSIQFTALRSFIERVVGMHHVLSCSIQRATKHDDMSDVSAIATTDDTRRAPRLRTISVQGSDISLRVPLYPHESDCVCVEASLMTMTAGRDTFVFSLRKTSILTHTSTSNPVLISPTSAEELARNSAEWAVVVRGLDLDISHNFNRSTLSSELSEQRRSEWNVQVLSTAAFFVTASQVRVLRLTPRSLRSTVSTDDGPADCQASSSSKDGGGHPDFNLVSSIPLLSSFEHFTLRLETQGLSVELLNEDDNGVVISTIARLEVDPMQLSLRQAREDRGCELETLVTRWSLTSQALRLEDRCFEMPSRLREVITTKRNSGRNQDNSKAWEEACQTMPVLNIQGITRTDKEGAAKSSLEIQVNGVRIVPSPSLHERVMMFLAHSSISSQSEQSTRPLAPVDATGYHVEDRLSGSSGETPLCEGSSPEESSPSDVEGQVPIKKLSLKLLDVVIQVFGKGRGIGESSALLCIGSLKTSLLFASVGRFLPGSQLRARDISVSMIWLPAAVVTAEQSIRDVANEVGLHKRSDQRTFRTQTFLTKDRNEESNRSGAHPSLSVPHSLTIPRERFRWNFFRQEYDGQQLDQILSVPSAALRLPTEDSDRMVLLVPVVSVDSPIQSLVSFAHVISVLDFLPRFAAETEILLPPIQVSLNNVSVRVQVPTTASENVHDGRQHHVVLRVRCAINGVVGRAISGLTASVKLRVDAIDEERGLRDQVCSPCIVEVESHISQGISISVRGERLVRLVLSPLTARAITGLLLSSSPKQKKPRNVRSRSRVASELSQVPNQTSLEAQRLRLSVSLRGVSVCCIAEKPRLQLLRLNLREIRIVGYVPLAMHGGGEIEIVLQDFKLEDTFSWRLYGHEEWSKDSIGWTNVVVGMRDASTNSGRPPPVMNDRLSQLQPPTLPRQNHDLSPMLQPVLVCQASWRFPFDYVSAHVQTRGFELNLNMAIAPTLTAWAQSVLREIRSVHSAYASPFDRESTNRFSQGKNTRGFRIGINHVVIEPVNVVVSTKAPPPRIQETRTRRALMWLLGSESAAGVSIRIPAVVFTGDFAGSDRFLERIRSIYAYALTSRNIGRQLALQAPNISRLLRVVAMSFLRRRQINWFNDSETALNSQRSSALRRRKSRGLVEVTVGSTQRSPLIYER